MKKALVVFSLFAVVAFCNFKIADTSPRAAVYPSFNPHFQPPDSVKDLFELSQDYPDTYRHDEPYPWQSIRFEDDYAAYANAVLGYCLEGNLDVDFAVQRNPVRTWYHAPWLHDDGRASGNGRECIHGLTRERATPQKELHPLQNRPLENWAVGFYNAPGGYTIGQVWPESGAPQVERANFPEGTVSFKLLFTDGTPDEVPYLRGTKEWKAHIYECAPNAAAGRCATRVVRTVRLLQIDIAVKDRRAPNGWVFGTFVYDGSRPGTSVWDRMVPVGLAWGDDPVDTAMMRREGAFENPRLTQTRLNASLIRDWDPAEPDKAFMTHHGLGGRLNGPVDNPISSCMSCHSKAAVTLIGAAAPMLVPGTKKTIRKADFEAFFNPIPAGDGKLVFRGKEYRKTDYSLQLSQGIRNYYDNIAAKAPALPGFASLAQQKKLQPLRRLPLVTRDGLEQVVP